MNRNLEANIDELEKEVFGPLGRSKRITKQSKALSTPYKQVAKPNTKLPKFPTNGQKTYGASDFGDFHKLVREIGEMERVQYMKYCRDTEVNHLITVDGKVKIAIRNLKTLAEETWIDGETLLYRTLDEYVI